MDLSLRYASYSWQPSGITLWFFSLVLRNHHIEGWFVLGGYIFALEQVHTQSQMTCDHSSCAIVVMLKYVKIVRCIF